MDPLIAGATTIAGYLAGRAYERRRQQRIEDTWRRTIAGADRHTRRQYTRTLAREWSRTR